MKTYTRILTIATSDSGGGAGIQADLKAISANGAYGLSVLVALTAQNTRGVTGIFPLPPEFVEQQMDAVMPDIGADAVKLGMLFSAELMQTVAKKLIEHNARHIVLDPVMVAQSGDKLIRDDAILALKINLLPIAELITPNLPEAEVLLDRRISTPAEVEQAAKDLAAFGCQNVLIKGGHFDGAESDDILYISAQNRIATFRGPRIPTRNNHGTGCTLSSAIATHLGKGDDIESAVQHGKDYITRAIQAGADYHIGHGAGPVHHFWKYWE